MSSFVIESKLNIFVLLHYIVTFNFYFVIYYIFIHSICICFNRIDWLNSFTSFELKAILCISSVKILWFSLLNLCCVFNISLPYFKNSFWISSRLTTSNSFFSKWFISLSIWAASKQSLQSWNLNSSFFDKLSVPFDVLTSSL